MKPEEIKKALEILEGNTNCEDCAFLKKCKGTCVFTNTLDLINQYEAENERLKNAVNRLINRVCDLKEKDETRHKVFMTKCEELETAKAEAIKEFAERFEPKLANNADITMVGYQSIIDDIENLLKEMGVE